MEVEKIRSLVSEAGWYEGRKIDITYVVEDLKKSGYAIPNKLISKILEEFWNIQIYYTYSDGYETNIYLNVDDAISNTTNQRSEDIRIRVKETVVPVGTMIDTYYVIWLSYSGKFYISQLATLYYLGNNIFSMIECVILEKDLESREIR